MLKLKKTAKETAAELKRCGYTVEWKIAKKAYEARDRSGDTVRIYTNQTAEAGSIQKENSLVAAYHDFFEYEDQEITADAQERAQNALQDTSERSTPTAKENATQGDFEALYEDAPGLTVSLPLDGFTDAALDNLRRIVKAKETLICKALNTDSLDIVLVEDGVSFPWWNHMPSVEEIGAYSAFIAAIGRMAKTAKRVNTTAEREVESERYAFRGFLLRLGFIGPDSAAHRKILLNRLSGSAAFPNATKYTTFCNSQKAKRDAAKEVGV